MINPHRINCYVLFVSSCLLSSHFLVLYTYWIFVRWKCKWLIKYLTKVLMSWKFFFIFFPSQLLFLTLLCVNEEEKWKMKLDNVAWYFYAITEITFLSSFFPFHSHFLSNYTSMRRQPFKSTPSIWRLNTFIKTTKIVFFHVSLLVAWEKKVKRNIFLNNTAENKDLWDFKWGEDKKTKNEWRKNK